MSSNGAVSGQHAGGRDDAAAVTPRAAHGGRVSRLTRHAFVVPGLVFLGAFFIAPIGYLFVLSLHLGAQMGQIDDAWTLTNYTRFLSDAYYRDILTGTLGFGAATAAICAIAGFPFSYFLARTQSRWRTPLLFVTVLPLLISAVIRNLGWIPVLGEHGMLNRLLLDSGLVAHPVGWIYNATGALIGMVHVEFPFMVLLLTGAIQKIDPALEQAAINLGATPAQAFWHVVLPLCRPGLAAGAALVFMGAISALVTPTILGGGRVMLMALYIDQQIHSVLNYPVGSTAAMLTMAAALVSLVLAARLGGARR
ncbi:ABC transporter permease [Paraburkholderia xenovorans]|uniref:ABC transporter permease n=1 Tax=Paraburkholderia xenovorans TaxID=36873 RepID=UPI0015584B81|nr:ABC transporter permease [Paraburkholderia xenovorans]NPT39122.1 ABC transporter permease subunit [Paraburkholderia xenovorans]